MKLHQKKFYSSPEVDKIVEQHAKETGYGYSESLRHIVMSWVGGQVPVISQSAYEQYLRDFPVSEIDIRG